MKYKVYTHRTDNSIDAIRNSIGKSIVVDSAGDFYSQLNEACSEGLSTTGKYDILKSVFRRTVEQATANCNISFVGLFAKLDYCIKEFQVPYSIASLLQMARKEMFPEFNRKEENSDDTMERNFPHNLKATALLVYRLCGKEEIPINLKLFFPKADRKSSWGKFSEKFLRVVVEKWDDDFIWATEEENGTTIQICYGKENHILTLNGKFSWQYLKDTLWQGAQLNLVRLRQDERGLYYLPELIILEPDYLVNITTIAGCFETYAESPFVNLINKLKPRQNTMPIHLGNFAGQMLDDTVHGRNITFDDSLKEFIKTNALNLISCQEFIHDFARFKNDAKIQKRNIEKLIGEDLKHDIGNYDTKDAILEPSFFSNILGIQGRMDFFYSQENNDNVNAPDNRYIIIEQKAGKAAFVPFSAPGYDPNVPEMKEQHHVQLILYRALFLYGFNKFANQISNFLLYSKYSKGLLAVPQNPQLLLSAIKIRNLIAWSEILYAKEGLDILQTLSPDMLNLKHTAGKLWENYTRPQLAEILDPIHEASPLERAYYLRFMQFIEEEALLSKVGNKTKESSGFASVWHDTIEEKKAAGNIYDNLSIAEYGEDEGGVFSVTLNFGDSVSTDTTNFRTGDIVILYYYGKDEVPDACAQMVFRGNIEEIREKSIVLRLRNSQTDRQIFEKHKDKLWAIEHDMFESSTSSLYCGMHSFLSATKPRRDLILLQREPKIDTTQTIKGSYGSFNTLVTRAKQARDLFLIIGPPGTGKTSFGLVNLLKEELLEPDSNILLLSYTNRAVDEICSKLVEIKEKENPEFDFIRIGSDLSCSKEYRPYLLREISAKSDKGGNALMQRIKQTRVFCGTTAALSASMALFKLKRFSLAIIDESSQILEPHLIGLLSAHEDGKEAIERFVLIGDHKQLPAVVQQTQEESVVKDEILNSIHLTDCRNSLFERLLNQFKTDSGYDSRFVYMLTKQGRMHQDIAAFPNQAFYGGKLQVVPLEHQLLPNMNVKSDNGIINMLATRRIAFVCSERPKYSLSGKTNSIEAEMIANTVYQIYQITKDRFSTEQTVGVIVPYRNQISTVRNAIDKFNIPILHDITIDTVERYQGSQRDYIIYGFTIQQKYQLNFLTDNVFEEDGMLIDRKLNVAMTRARLNLVLIGNPWLLKKNVTFKKLMDFIKEKNGFIDVSHDDYCNGNFSIPQ